MLSFAVISWRTVVTGLKDSVKSCQTVKAALHGNVSNGILGIIQKQFCMEQTPFGQIFITDSNKVRIENILSEIGNESKTVEIEGGVIL